MKTEQDREQFEEWFADHSGQTIEWVKSQRETEYHYKIGPEIQRFWMAWQASRAAQPASPALKLPWHEKQCSECGSKSLSWGFAIINKSTVQNGLLRICDVDGLFYLGCEECSETVTQVSPDEVVELLSALQQSINAPHTAQIEPICATGGAEWVKVSERMPRHRQSVLGWQEKPGTVIECYPEGIKWYYDYSDGPCGNVTHWMPLPAAPNGKT
ncbi:hypothetical protein AC790_13300 [Pantoea sp. RIT-PI-b]|uniref:DUF551 domain-containing protein n=1 Tax=Pantoea sp. RIT-PI-b TaxID=1681195 RepID=UPI00067664C2|nr:DUF551 domain-containing protein [Pantoea sp. RIT-PI-b]KNC11542.1 hypothetical protein AC790_13300 [Pantoea sp. RIT-PI-b]